MTEQINAALKRKRESLLMKIIDDILDFLFQKKDPMAKNRVELIMRFVRGHIGQLDGLDIFNQRAQVRKIQDLLSSVAKNENKTCKKVEALLTRMNSRISKTDKAS